MFDYTKFHIGLYTTVATIFGGLFAAGDKIEEAEVWLGNDARVALSVRKDLVVTFSRSARKGMEVAVQYDGPIPAPVKKGESVGQIVVTAPDTPPHPARLLYRGVHDGARLEASSDH